ncbi:MAG: hypothetical protein ACE5EU_08415 [Paracoccaceae bacterium]
MAIIGATGGVGMRRLIAAALPTAAAGLLIAGGALSGPLPAGPVQLYAAPGTFQIAAQDGGTSLGILDGQGGEVARYELTGCRFENGDGVFELIFPGAVEPMVAAICHPAGGGQRFSVFAPDRDARRPVLEIAGDSFVRFAVRPGVLAFSHDTGGRTVEELWHPGVAADAGELEWARALMVAAAGRRRGAPEPVDDPDVRALAGRLAEIAASRDAEALVAMASPDILLSFGGNGGVEEFRALIAEPWFWPEFERVLDGGGVLAPGSENGRVAIFPALFHNWPDDLDVFGYLYGDRPGSKLRAGPSDQAPAIADLHGRIVTDGPHLEAYERLIADGWVHVCTKAEGCGFAHSDDVRSPIDWRAIFTQTGSGAPWVLETYVAGD